MNKDNYIFLLLAVLGLSACSSDEEAVSLHPEAVELTKVDAAVYGTDHTRTRAYLGAEQYVGRPVFKAGDQMTFTTIKRTQHSIDEFTYSGIVYNYESGGWTRDASKGQTATSTIAPQRIYWSDAASAHTYIGYCLPMQAEGTTFDWNLPSGSSYYYGSLGDPKATGFIDHTDSTKIAYDDLLLTYDDQKVAEPGGSVAMIYYHHALACVRVVVDISGFTPSESSEDAKTVVSNMILKNMFTLYKWDQLSNGAVALTEDKDKDVVSSLYSGVAYDQRKDTHLWIPKAEGVGTGSAKRFTFYGLAVPCTMGVDDPTAADGQLQMEFTVTYPNALRPTKMEEHTYKASMPGSIKFMPGYCTTINISLNHANEQITVGAEYMDWQFVDTPDQGELSKKSTFLTTTSRDSVTILSDAKATEDDATWLYKDAKGNIVDIYGHDGTATSPYTISTAKQLLSFAYEVKNGYSFKDQYVKLDANIHMQPGMDKTTIAWIGIGDESHPFDGWFVGGNRAVTLLKGAALFQNVGANGHIEQLVVEAAGDITGSGGLVEVNKGTISGCSFRGELVSSLSGTDNYVGGLVGTNNGNLLACYHNGTITANCNVGGLAGSNMGNIVGCYSVGELKAGTGCATGGIAANFAPQTETNKIFGCYYNADLLTPTYNDGSTGLTTYAMQKESFVGPRPTAERSEADYTSNQQSLNYALWQWWKAHSSSLSSELRARFLLFYFEYEPAAYPSGND